jgi:hypothetical protein
MRSRVGIAIDSRLEELLVARVRRQWPVLCLAPSRWIRPVIRPAALRLRGSLTHGALALAVFLGTILTLLILTS